MRLKFGFTGKHTDQIPAPESSLIQNPNAQRAPEIQNGNGVEATGLRKHFGSTLAVDGIGLHVLPGEAYGLIGADGAGKTTTLRLLVGALTPEAGEVSIAGYRLATEPEQARSVLGYLAQRFSLYGDLTVAENFRFFAEIRGVARSELAERRAELLGFVGLAGFEGRLAGQLSGGMKQKLGLACALAHRPRVLLLDEPTTGVDPVTRQDFWQLIIRLLAEGMCVIVSTPYMDEAARCTRVGFVSGGRILTEGTPRELTARLDGRVLELIAEPRRLAQPIITADPDVEDATVFGDRLHLRVRAAAGPLERLPSALAATGITVHSLRPIRPGLEDVFIALLQQGVEEHG